MRVQLTAVLVAAIAAGGFAFAQDKKDTKDSKAVKKPAAKALTVRLSEQTNSGQSGTARLTPAGDKTRVVISLKGGEKGVAQPAHIHEGTCTKLDPKPRYGLENVVDGKSSTEVPASLGSLRKGNFAINVHKSKEDIKTYVACGNISRGTGAAKKTGAKSPEPK